MNNLSQLVEQRKFTVNKQKNKTYVLMKSDLLVLQYLQYGKSGLSTARAKEDCTLSTAGIINSAKRLRTEGFIQQHEDKEYSITDLGKQLYWCMKHLI